MALVISLIVLTLVGRVQELVRPLAAIKPVMLAMILGGVTLLIFFPYHTLGQRWRRVTILWTLVSVGYVLSVPTSLYIGKSVQFLALTYLCTVFLFLLVSQCVQQFHELETISRTLVFMTTVLGLAIIAIPKRLVTDTGFRYSVSDSYDANDLAVVFAMGVPFAFYWFWRGGIFMKLTAVVTVLLSANGILLSGSRGGLITLGTVAIYMTLRVKELGVALRSLMLVGMVVGGAAATQTETFQSLIDGVSGRDYNWSEDDGRITVWKRGVGYALSHPITGVGITCFQEAEGLLSGRSSTAKGIRWTEAHSSYVQVMAENGLITFALWLAMIFASIGELRRQGQRLEPFEEDPEVHRMLVLRGAIQTSLWAFVVGGFFLSLGYLVYLYLMVAMTVAMATLVDRTLEEKSWAWHPESEPREAGRTETVEAVAVGAVHEGARGVNRW